MRLLPRKETLRSTRHHRAVRMCRVAKDSRSGVVVCTLNNRYSDGHMFIHIHTDMHMSIHKKTFTCISTCILHGHGPGPVHVQLQPCLQSQLQLHGPMSLVRVRQTSTRTVIPILPYHGTTTPIRRCCHTNSNVRCRGHGLQ